MGQDRQQKIANYFLGVDLGQAQDYTALALVEQVVGYRGFNQSGRLEETSLGENEQEYNLVGLRRLALNTSYPAQVKEVKSVFEKLPVPQGEAYLAIDKTGVGRAVFDLFTQAGLKPIGITITGGDRVNPDGVGGYRVPKRDLVSNFQALMQSGRFKAAPGIQEATTLAEELRSFRYKLNDNANDLYGAREGAHDDLVLAVAVALWSAVNQSNNNLGLLDPEIVLALANFTGNGW